jgi:hypothetical protein
MHVHAGRALRVKAVGSMMVTGSTDGKITLSDVNGLVATIDKFCVDVVSVNFVDVGMAWIGPILVLLPACASPGDFRVVRYDGSLLSSEVRAA